MNPLLNTLQPYPFAKLRKLLEGAKLPEGLKPISLSIGEPKHPAPETVKQSLFDHQALFEKYPPIGGYPELKEAIGNWIEKRYGVKLDPASQILPTNGSREALFALTQVVIDPTKDPVVVTPNPFYQIYEGAAKLAGAEPYFCPMTAKTGFKSDYSTVPEEVLKRTQLLFVCSPNNPTGTTLTKDELKKWVNYALANDVLIMYDSAYEAYIQDPNIPHSIYEIKGAKKVAIEFRSFSKTAGFTGIRCGYTVVPKELNAFTLDGQRVQLNKLWNRRQCTKFNGTSYITQRGAEAVYSTAGKQQVTATINYYMTNAKIMKEGLQNCGLTVYGGDNAPYLWLKTPDGLSSWKFFDKLLYEVNIVGTPGVGFGPGGEGFLRLTAFGDRDDTLEAMSRLKKWLL